MFFQEYYEKCMRNLFFVWETAVQLILLYFLYEKHKEDFFLYEKPLAGEFPPQTLARHNTVYTITVYSIVYTNVYSTVYSIV